MLNHPEFITKDSRVKIGIWSKDKDTAHHLTTIQLFEAKPMNGA